MLYRPFKPSVESKPTIDTKSGGLGTSTKKKADKPKPTWLDKAGSAFEKAQARFARTAPKPDPIKLYNKPEFTLPFGKTFPSNIGATEDKDEERSTTGTRGITPEGDIVEYGLPEMTISDATAPYRAVPTLPAIQTGELAPAIQDTTAEEKQALIDMEEAAIERMASEGGGLMSKRPKARPEGIKIVEEAKPIPEDAPINVKNNNLGNIKNIQANLWKGQTNLGTGETFASFKTPELGIRALKKVIVANIDATDTFEEYVNRYASEPEEKEYYKQNGKLLPHLQNYAKLIAKSQGVKSITDPIPSASKRDLLSWIKATAKAEGGEDALKYFTDDVINRGLKLR